MTPVLVDTGFLVALYDRREPRHSICQRFHDEMHNPLVTCEPVISEALHLLQHLPDAQQGILASIDQELLELRFSLSTSAAQVRFFMSKYADTPVDLADACLIQMADQLSTGDILTLDSDFEHYRWRKNRKFNLLIPLA